MDGKNKEGWEASKKRKEGGTYGKVAVRRPGPVPALVRDRLVRLARDGDEPAEPVRERPDVGQDERRETGADDVLGQPGIDHVADDLADLVRLHGRGEAFDQHRVSVPEKVGRGERTNNCMGVSAMAAPISVLTFAGQTTEVRTFVAPYRARSSAVRTSWKASTPDLDAAYSDRFGIDMYEAEEAVVMMCPWFFLMTDGSRGHVRSETLVKGERTGGPYCWARTPWSR